MNLIIVDDHPLFRAGTKMTFTASKHQIIGDAANSATFFELLKKEIPDLVLLDIYLNDTITGVDIARRLKKEYPNIKILILSIDTSIHTIKELLEIGIDGFISKNSADEDVIHAVDVIESGKPYFGKDIDKIVCEIIASQKANKDMLTSRELEIISLICQGKLGKEIADIKSISLRTVDTHKTNIFQKLNIDNSIELVIYAIKHKIIEI